MNTKNKVMPGASFKYETTMIYTAVHPHPEADFAMKLMAHFGSVAAMPDGEDSAGRSKLRLQTPAELVARCCEIADLAYQDFAKRDWLLEMPEPVKRTKADE